MMKYISFEELQAHVPGFVPIGTVLEEGIPLDGVPVSYTVSGSSIDGYIQRLSEGRFTIIPLFCGTTVCIEVLVREGLINEETLAELEAAQMAATVKQTRVSRVDTACRLAEGNLLDARKFAEEKVGREIMKEAIERLGVILDEHKAAYKAETGEDWYFDCGY